MKGTVFGSLLLVLLVAMGCDGQRPDPKSALRVAGTPCLAVLIRLRRMLQVLEKMEER